MWTNGKQKEVYRKYVNDKGQIDFMDYNDIPSADGSLDDINRPKRTSLKNAYDDNLLFVFKTCHNHIHVNDTIVEHLKKYAKEVTTIGDERISKQIILEGVFKRTYVEEEYGYPFLGGKEITQLSPKTEKYLSKRFIKSDMKRSLKLQRIQF